MSISRWLDRSFESQTKSGAKTADVIVIGGGIAGISTAYWLQKKDPGLKVTVLEKDRIGFGASGRNAGFVTCGSLEHFMKLEESFGLAKATEIWKFSEENHRLLAQEIVGADAESAFQNFDYRRTGSCTVAPSEERWSLYQKTAKVMREQGIAVKEVDGEEMRREFGVNGFKGGIEYAGDGYIHPIKLLTAIRSKLKSEIVEGVEVFGVEKEGSAWEVRTDLGLYRAPKIVMTLNAYLPLVLKEFLPLVTPGRGQILLTEPLPQFVRGPCYLTKHLVYFRQLPTGHLLIGGFRNLAAEIENTYADQTTPLIQGALFKFVQEHFQYGAQAKIAYQWSGVMGFTPDGQQLMGELPNREGVHILAGCSGHGMGLNFHAGKVLAESLFGASIPSHLDVKRFVATNL